MLYDECLNRMIPGNQNHVHVLCSVNITALPTALNNEHSNILIFTSQNEARFQTFSEKFIGDLL